MEGTSMIEDEEEPIRCRFCDQDDEIELEYFDGIGNVCNDCMNSTTNLEAMISELTVLVENERAMALRWMNEALDLKHKIEDGL